MFVLVKGQWLGKVNARRGVKKGWGKGTEILLTCKKKVERDGGWWLSSVSPLSGSAVLREERLKPKAPAGLHWINSSEAFEIQDVASKWVKADLVSCVARMAPLQTACLGKLHTFPCTEAFRRFLWWVSLGGWASCPTYPLPSEPRVKIFAASVAPYAIFLIIVGEQGVLSSPFSSSQS